MLVKLKQQTGSTMHNKTDVDSCQRTIRAIEIETYNLEHPTDLRQMPPVDSVVIGVNRDECIKHAEFRDKHGISVPLLSDTDGVACKQYCVWQAKEVDGVRKHGIVRSTFVIDKQGVLRFALYGVNAKGHALEMLRVVKELNS